MFHYDTSRWRGPRISRGNIKLGKHIPNINLSPVLTCQGMPCLTDGCYAMKSLHYPSVRDSWTFNVELFRKNKSLFFGGIIDKFIRKKKIPFVRWHSSGEIINTAYFEGMKTVAHSFPNTRFLCFTKKYSLAKVMHDCPDNLSMVFSTWPGMKLPRLIRIAYNIAWMDDSSEKEAIRIKAESINPIKCPGNCERCKTCWYINKKKQDIIFHKH